MRILNLSAAVAAMLGAVSADITVLPGGEPRPYRGRSGVTSVAGFFNESTRSELNWWPAQKPAQVIMSSYDVSAFGTDKDTQMLPSGDSFVRSAIQAWGEHLHLVVRPEEVWFTILVQMNFYMTSHAEQVRSMFVNHAGQETIYIKDFTWYDVLRQFKDEIQKRVKTSWLLDWIMPDFSTTTENDIMVANVLMMGLTKAYFRYEGEQVCGLPSVTLQGTQGDWEKLLAKLDRLSDFGEEPAQYAKQIRPILSRFVTTFTQPDSAETRDFWNKIVTAEPYKLCGAPPYFISGWITGFHFWNDMGNAMYKRTGTVAPAVVLDGIEYPRNVDIRRLPMGVAGAPFLMHKFNNTEKYEAYVAAGTIGKQVKVGPPAGYEAALARSGKTAGGGSVRIKAADHATLQPLSSWVLYGPVQHNKTDGRFPQQDEVMWDLLDAVRYGFTQGGLCKA